MDNILLPIKKIILGAHNLDNKQIRHIVELYTKVGANMFDITSNVKLIKKISKNLNKSKVQNKILLCVSITLNDDIHANKAFINIENCKQCNKCIKVCPQNAIRKNSSVFCVEPKKCSGCQRCLNICLHNAIRMKNISRNFYEQFSKIKHLPIDCIEIHTNGKDKDLYHVFEILKNEFFGIIGICIANNNNLEEKIEIIENVKKIIAPKKLLVQADGTAISGFDNTEETTQKALEECKKLSCIKDIYLIPSGGVNAKTYMMAKAQNIKIDGIAVGSYARKIVAPYISLRKKKTDKFRIALKEADMLMKSIG